MRSAALLLALWLSVPALLPAQSGSTAPAPDAFFGFAMGTDGRLAGWPELELYLEAVAAASDRVTLVDAGPTTEGRRLRGAIVSSPANLARLDEIKAASRRLADPRAIGVADARALATRQPVIVVIGASIHASEIGATQTMPELLHMLATAEDEATRRVLDEVVLILFPSLNPDGHVLTVDWYNRWRGTDFEGSPMPWLYHKYVGHDINRDAFMMNVVENRSLAHFFYREWHPQVFLSMHQMGQRGARYFVPPNYDPIDPNHDPLIWRTAGLLGHAMALAMEEDGRQGVLQSAMYDYYWPGYEDSAPLGHNVVTLLTEAASVNVASPIRVSPIELQGTPRGLPEYRAQINFPNPWPGGAWRLRDIVDYNLSAVRGLLTGASRYRQEIVRNFYTMGRRAVVTGSEGAPFAFIIPPEQHDPHAAHRLRELLLDGSVEIMRAAETFRVADTVYPAGTDLVLMAQPYRAYAKTLLEQQVYPVRRLAPEAAPERPYDVAGWTLPFQMGVHVDRIEQTFEPPPSVRLTETQIAPAYLWGEPRPDHYVVDGRGTAGTLALNRLLAAGLAPSWTTAPAELLGYSYPPGSIVVEHSNRAREVVTSIVNELGLRATGARGRAPSNLRPLGRPRVGLYKPWVASIDEGWTRWLLEQYGFPFSSLTDQDVRRGGLRASFDAIVLPDMDAERLRSGHAPLSMPPEYVGGLGDEGVAALQEFVRAGGTLIAIDSASQFAIETLSLPVRDTLRGRPADEFFCPGSILRLEVDVTDPLAYGMTPEAGAFFAFGSGFAVDEGDTSVRVPGRYASEDVLMSGWLEGEAHIAGQGAVVEARVGQGRAVLLGFRAQHRAQSHGTFRLLFNAIHTAAAGRR
ncbi:MAG: M14 family metallopeptidase [Vicinamibacterales bacterium]|nr:M14 family metallopeptidase [Vicinamibacterales bacterium]